MTQQANTMLFPPQPPETLGGSQRQRPLTFAHVVILLLIFCFTIYNFDSEKY